MFLQPPREKVFVGWLPDGGEIVAVWSLESIHGLAGEEGPWRWFTELVFDIVVE